MAQQGDLSPAVLGRTKLFGGLDVALLVALRAAMHEVHFDSGQLIFSRGDSAKSIYVVLEGQVRISVLTAEGRELCSPMFLPVRCLAKSLSSTDRREAQMRRH